MLIIEISYNFLYVWNCIDLHKKKLLIYENCVTSIFGQPGIFLWFISLRQSLHIRKIYNSRLVYLAVEIGVSILFNL